MGAEARKFALQINQEWLAAQDDIHEAVELISLEAFKRIVQKSPVDSGRFRGNWNADIGAMNEATTELLDPTGSASIARASGVIEGYSERSGYPAINITNGLPYAVRLEDRYSGQAPNGMVALTVTEIEAMFDGYEV